MGGGMRCSPLQGGWVGRWVGLLTFSCLKCRRSLISRRIRFASTVSSKALDTFLMATLRFWTWSIAELW